MIKREISIGVISGLLATLAGTILYIVLFSKVGIERTLELAAEKDVLGSLLALGAIANFLPFFVFLKKKQDYKARGVLIVSLLTAAAVAILKFI